MRPCDRSRLTMRLTWVCAPSSLNGMLGLFGAGMPNSGTPGSFMLGMGSFMLGMPGSLIFGIPASPGTRIPGACGPIVLEIPPAGCGIVLGARGSISEPILKKKKREEKTLPAQGLAALYGDIGG